MKKIVGYDNDDKPLRIGDTVYHIVFRSFGIIRKVDKESIDSDDPYLMVEPIDEKTRQKNLSLYLHWSGCNMKKMTHNEFMIYKLSI